MKDIFAIQSDVARQIAAALKVTLSEAEKAHIERKQTENIEAYNLYLMGRHHWNKRAETGLWKAIELFQNAIELDPNYALAYTGLADAYSILAGWFFEPPKSVFPKAKTAAIKALELDESLAAGHLSLAFIQHGYDWDWQRADKSCRRAIELDPKNAFAHYWYSIYLESAGKIQEATKEVLLAQKLDPFALQIQVGVGTHFSNIRQYDRGIDELKKAFEITPDFAGAHHWIGRTYLGKEMPAEALAEFEHSESVRGSSLEQAIALWKLGKQQEAMALVSETRQSAETRFVDPSFFAEFYAQTGEIDEACRWLEEAYQQRSIKFIWLRGNWLLDPLRSDPRFVEILEKMGLKT